MNDPYSTNYDEIIEKFIRSVLLHYSQPGLIFTKFSRKSRFYSVEIADLTESSIKDNILPQLTKKYKLKSLNLIQKSFQLHET